MTLLNTDCKIASCQHGTFFAVEEVGDIVLAHTVSAEGECPYETNISEIRSGQN